MNRITEEQKRRNQQSRESWDRFRPHRERVRHLLSGAATTGGSLCVLGAGNSNDLDLNDLLTRYERIHLVDLDTAALRFGVTRQDCENTDRIFLHGEVDVAFVTDRLARASSPRPPSDGELDQWFDALATHAPLELPGPFDTVASLCLLTQLLESVGQALGDRHPRCVDLKMQLRTRHLKLLLDLSRPGGTAALVLDFVSSATCPELARIPEGHLMAAAKQLINQRNFFTGVNPTAIRNLLVSDPVLAPLVESARITRPWRWDLGPRLYLVCAVVIRRR